MRYIFSLTFIFLIVQSNFVFGQNEYQYALDIQNYKEKILRGQFTKLKNFVIDPEKCETDSEIIKLEFDKFKKKMDYRDNFEIYQEGLPPPAPVIGTSLLGSILSQENFIVAFTDVIIDRAKEELAIAYFDRATERMKRKNIKINFGYGCPETSLALSTIFPNFYFIAENSRTNLNINIGSTLISAFQTDLNGMYNRIDEKIIPDCYKETDFYTIQNSSYEFYNNLKRGISIEKSLVYLKPVKEDDFGKVDHYLNLLSICSNSLMGKGTDRWVDVKKSSLNHDGRKFYLKLLDNNKNYESTLQAIGFKGVNKYDAAYRDFFFKLVDRYIALKLKLDKSSVENIKPQGQQDESTGSQKNNGYNYALDIASELIYIIKDFTELPDFKEGNKVIKGTEISLQVISFYKSIYNENYGAAALAILTLLDQFSSKDNILTPELVKYITLAADISQAESSHAAKLILENAILPVGSYKLKRSSKYSASINAYIGLNGGFEILDQPNNGGLGGRSGYVGPFLPVGVDFSTSNGSDEEIGGSMSIFISAFDFGTVAGYRFKADANYNENNIDYEVERFPKLKFQHFISPGIFFIRGSKKSPISWGVGGQYTPRLRSIKEMNGNELEFNATSFRLTAFLAVDIPLLNIAVKGQKAKEKKNKQANRSPSRPLSANPF